MVRRILGRWGTGGAGGLLWARGGAAGLGGEGWREADSEVFARLGEVFTPGREEIGRVLMDHIPA